MPGFPAARVTDMHTCPMCMGAPFPILPPGAPTVLIGKLPAARLSDLSACIIPALVPVPSVDPIIFGSPTVVIMGMPAARLMDPTAKGGMILPPCCPTVLIGLVGVPTITPPGMPGMPDMLGGGGRLNEYDPVGPWPVADLNPDDGDDADLVNLRIGRNVEIFGRPAFANEILQALVLICSKPTGAALFESIQNAPGTLLIEETMTGNGFFWEEDERAFQQPGGQPGLGGGEVKVEFNPYQSTVGDGTKRWHTRPPCVGLAHELIHANDCLYGGLIPGAAQGVPIAEMQAVGLGPFTDRQFTERRIRHEMGEPDRDEY